MIKLDDRLFSLVKYVNKCDSIIDIGCDHALLDIYLIQEKVVNNIIISDVSRKALSQGINNINKYELNKYIDARCGNGLDVLKKSDSIDTVIISGMGSNTIIKILDNPYINKINKLIIQSNNDYYLLRKTLTKMGFIIQSEEAIESNNKYYLNIIFIRGEKEYNINQLKYGVNIINKDIYYNYLIKKNNNILKNINNNDKKKYLLEEIEYLKSRIDL